MLKPSPFTVKEFRDWAATKPADEGYQYLDNCGCALAQFIIAKGYDPKPMVGDRDWTPSTRDGDIEVPAKLFAPLSGLVETFGALVARIDAL